MSPTAIMFHSVGLDRFQWSYAHIAEPPSYFEAKISALSAAGYSASFFVRCTGDRGNSPRQVALTLDDGYLDNWVHVGPILQKYGFKATVFATPEFVDPRPVVRPQVEPGSLEDDTHEAVQCCAGFLSWPELREMEKSGLFDIQSHGLTHAWYFKGPRIVDYWHPGAATDPLGPVWMLWNEQPERKPFYLTEARDREATIPLGTPIYEYGKSLETRRFTPEPFLAESLQHHVREQGGESFFGLPDWRRRLDAFVDRVLTAREGAYDAGEYETEHEYRRRVRYELSESKAILERELGKTITALCWPGGGVTETVVEIAREVGYKYFTLPSAWRGRHTVDGSGGMVSRIGSKTRVRWSGRDLGRPTPQEFLWHVESSRRPVLYKLLTRAALAARLGWSLVRRPE